MGHRLHLEIAAGWDAVARGKYREELPVHAAHLLAGGDNLLSDERALVLPFLKGADVVQFQCSFGLDALGLINAGAGSVVGVDISSAMIELARELAAQVGNEGARFVTADVSSELTELRNSADLLYTGRGSLPWIMDLAPWAESVARTLRPGGRLVVYEGHPLASLWDRDASAPKLRSEASYFADVPREEPGFPAAAAERELGTERPVMHERAWRIGEVLQSLLDRGLVVEQLHEYPMPFWDQFPNWDDADLGRLPMTWGLVARLPESVGT